MSQENVEMVRRLYEHWARGDFSAPGFFDPDVVYSRIGTETPGLEGEWRGLEAMSAATREYFHGLLDIRNEAERIIDLGDDRVLVLCRQTARGKLSGAPFDQELADLLTLKDGKIVGMAAYWRRAEALEAVGLSEQDAHAESEQAMSQENVELVRRVSEAFSQAIANDDLTPVLRDFLDRDIYWRAAEGAIDDVGGMRGHDAIRRYIEDWTDDFDNLTLAPQEFVEVDDERVMAVQCLSGRAKHTGIATEVTFFVIYTIREGRFVEVREYVTREEALEAVGLSEQDAHAESE